MGALRHRNYRLFLTGQIISTVGTWMQSVAMPWLALELTHSGLLVGLALAAQFTPVLLVTVAVFSLFAMTRLTLIPLSQTRCWMSGRRALASSWARWAWAPSSGR